MSYSVCYVTLVTKPKKKSISRILFKITPFCIAPFLRSKSFFLFLSSPSKLIIIAIVPAEYGKRINLTEAV